MAATAVGATGSAAISARPSASWAARMAWTSRDVEGGEGAGEAADEVVAEVGGDAAERVGDAGAGGDQHAGDAELAGEGGGVQGAGAAEGEEGEVARVGAEGERDHADGVRHAGVGDAEDGFGGGLGGEAEGGGDGLGEDAARAASTAGKRAGSRRPRRRLASVMVGWVPPRPEAIGPGSAPALSGPTSRRPAALSRAMEPPPAPTVRTSTIGTWIGMAYSSSISLEIGGAPSRIRATSVEVPPMS